jgi:hypothetical protein
LISGKFDSIQSRQIDESYDLEIIYRRKPTTAITGATAAKAERKDIFLSHRMG